MQHGDMSIVADSTAQWGVLDAALRATVDGMLILDRDCRFIAFSPGCERITGYAKSELLGTQHLPPDSTVGRVERVGLLPDVLGRGLAALAGEVSSVRQRARVQHRSGQLVWVELTYLPMRDSNGKIACTVCIVRDVARACEVPGKPMCAENISVVPSGGEGNTPDLEPAVPGDDGDTPPEGGEDALDNVLHTVEKREILAALRRSGGQRSRAARALGISRSRLYRRMEALGIDPRADV